MGFETAVVISIFFVSILILGTNTYVVMSSSNDVISDAEDIRYELQYERLNSAVSPDFMSLDNESSALMVEVTNSGNIVLDTNEISILVDGQLLDHECSPETTKWYPGEEKTFEVKNVSDPGYKRVKIVTDSGVCGYLSGVPDKIND